MAVASYDAKFSFQQDSVARLGDRAGGRGPLSEEQKKKFEESPAMIAARRADELAQQYTNERDNQRMIADTFFRAEESDWSAPKSFEYKRTVDYYNILGIEEHASLEEVKAAYKKLSLVYHPDKTKGLSKEQQEEYAKVFISVKNAHLVLADKPTRRQYDYDRDHDRAKAEVQGTDVHQEQHIDLTEVLERIKEMQRPPGKNVEVLLQCKLEKFFYGGRKELQRTRTVKDFYQGFITEPHTYRTLVQRGANEPLTTVFKEQGDWHADTKPDTITLRLSSKPHPHVERRGGDLLLKEELLLGEEVLGEPRLEADVPGLRGRHVLLWGRNPLRGARPGARMEVLLRGEGMAKGGALRLPCRVGAGGSGGGAAVEGGGAEPPALGREAARRLLTEATQAHAAWRREGGASGAGGAEGLRGRLSELLERHGCARPDTRAVHRWLSAALRQVPGEWALAARVSALLAEGDGRCPSQARFLARHGLAPPGGPAGPEAEAEEEGEGPWEAWAPLAGSTQRHGVGSLCSSPTLQRRREASDAACEVELAAFGEPTSLFTSPICTVAFYTNAVPVQGPAERLPPHSMFALCLSSTACSRKAAAPKWQALRDQLLPLLQSTAFLLLPAARQTLPQAVADFTYPRSQPAEAALQLPVPWKRLGDEAFGRGDYFEALGCYSCCLQALEDAALDGGDNLAARVLSNRAACLARVGDMEASVAEAKRAVERRPAWGRAWSRAAFALSRLGSEHSAEAFDACLKAAELEPSVANCEALAAAAQVARAPGLEAAQEASGEAKVEYREGRWAAAVARFTVALALLPAEGEELVGLRAAWHSNRAAAHCRLRRWEEAVEDGRAAVAAAPGWEKAHTRLGAALLGAGQTEQAYTEFAWALVIDNGNDVARSGQEACLCALPRWQSVPGRRRLEARFGADLGRPRATTRVFAISDLHYEHRPNEEWVHRLDELEYQQDVLIVAGNVSNTHYTATKALKTLKSKFRRVFYVPGNEDVWMNPGEVHNSRFPDSFAKFLALLETCDDLGVDVFPAAICSDVFVVPIFSWYNATFDKKSRPDPNYNPDETCVWPLDSREQLWKYMLKLNESLVERVSRGTVITFSHFLPLATLPFSSDGNIRAAQSMGCEDAEDYVRMARSALHIYGHSSLQASEQHGGLLFVNRYHGYAAEDPQHAPPPPLCVFDGLRGVCVSDDRAANTGAREER